MREVLSQAAGDWLRAHRWPRTTAVVGVTLGLLAACACSIGLLSVGLHNMAVRFALNVVAGYMTCVLFLGGWLLRIAPMPAKTLLADDGGLVRTRVPDAIGIDEELRKDVCETFRDLSDELEIAIAFWILIGLCGLLFLGCHLVFHAPWYLGKLMVDSGKVRHRSAPSGTRFGFLVLPIRESWPAAVLLVAHYATVGAAVQWLMRAA